MSKQPKASVEEKIAMVNACVMTKLHGNPEKLTYVCLERYVAELGRSDLKEIDFRRPPEVKNHVKALKSGNVSIDNLYILPPYRQLDMESWLKSVHMDPMESAAKLIELNDKCLKYSNALFQTQASLEIAKSKLERLLQESKLRNKKQVTWDSPNPSQQELTKLRERNDELESELKDYRSFMRYYVLPDIATSFLNERKRWTYGLHVLNPEQIQNLIAPKKPEPVPMENLSAKYATVSHGEENCSCAQPDGENLKTGQTDSLETTFQQSSGSLDPDPASDPVSELMKELADCMKEDSDD